MFFSKRGFASLISSTCAFLLAATSRGESPSPTSQIRNPAEQDPRSSAVALSIHGGWMTTGELHDAAVLHAPMGIGHLFSVEGSYHLAENCAVVSFVKPFATGAYWAMNFTLFDEPDQRVYNLNPYFALEWDRFPWTRWLHTRFSVGEGVSYASAIPAQERFKARNERRFLNYLLFETAFALPGLPEWELAGRIHHRSAAFGLYGGDNGSNALMVGARRFF